MRHGKYSASTILLKRQARQARRRLQVLALAARLGFDTIDGLCNDIFARLAARSAHRG
jgi:hypothetical protein